MRGNPSWSSVVGIWKKKRWFSAPHSGRWLISHHVSRVWLNHQVTVGTTHHSTSKAEKLCEGEHPRFVDQQNVTMIKGPLWKTPPLITPWSCYSFAIDICCSHGVDTGVIETRIQNLLYIYWWLMNHGPSKWVDWDMMTWGHSFGSLTIQFPQESMKVASRMASRMALRYKASSKHKQLNNVGILESPKRMGNPQLSFWLPWISALPRDAVPPFVLPNSTADAKGQCLGGCVPTCDFQMFNLRVQRLLRNQTRRLETGTISKSFYDIFSWIFCGGLLRVDCSHQNRYEKTTNGKMLEELQLNSARNMMLRSTDHVCKCKKHDVA